MMTSDDIAKTIAGYRICLIELSKRFPCSFASGATSNPFDQPKGALKRRTFARLASMLVPVCANLHHYANFYRLGDERNSLLFGGIAGSFLVLGHRPQLLDYKNLLFN